MVRLRWSLQALACSAEEQASLYPDFVCPGDELVLEFDQYNTKAQETDMLSAEARSALDALDDFLENHSGERYERMYLEPVGLGEPEWRDIRNLAEAALDALGWKHEIPPKDRGDIYIGQDRQIVLDKIRQIFPHLDANEVLNRLEALDNPEKYRVALAILKLSEVDGKESPDDFIESAARDYRDVLMWAEYPNEMYLDSWKEPPRLTVVPRARSRP